MHSQTETGNGLWADESFRLPRRRSRSTGTGGPLGRRGRRSGPATDFDLMLVPRVAGLGARTRSRARRWSGSRPSPGSRRSAERRRRGAAAPRRRLDRADRAPRWRPATGSTAPRRPRRRAAATPSTSGAPTRPRRCTSATSATSRSATRSAPPCSQAGARVERRSLICDVGRSMGEAMAGVVSSGRDQQVWPDGDEKSDHFVGSCYADYVTAGRASGGGERRRRRGLGRARVRAVQRQGRRADDAGPAPATRRRWNCGRRRAPG